MVFDLANWIILGGAFYIILDAIPNGPLSWKLLSKYDSQTDFAVKTLLVLGSIVLCIQFVFLLIGLFIGLYYYYFEDWPLNIGGKPDLTSTMLLIPLLSQLFRIKLLSQKPKGRLLVSTIILLSVLALWIFYLPLHNTADSDSFLGGLENSLFFNYLCGILLFFIVLDVVLILKKHKVIK